MINNVRMISSSNNSPKSNNSKSNLVYFLQLISFDGISTYKRDNRQYETKTYLYI